MDLNGQMDDEALLHRGGLRYCRSGYEMDIPAGISVIDKIGETRPRSMVGDHEQQVVGV